MAYMYYTAEDGSTHLCHAGLSNPGRKPGELSALQRIELNKKIAKNNENKKGRRERYDTNASNTAEQDSIRQAKRQAESYFNNLDKYCDDNDWGLFEEGRNVICENDTKNIKFSIPFPSGISPATWRSFGSKNFEGVGGTKAEYEAIRDFVINLKQRLMTVDAGQRRSNIFNSNMKDARRKAEEEQKRKGKKEYYSNTPFKTSKA